MIMAASCQYGSMEVGRTVLDHMFCIGPCDVISYVVVGRSMLLNSVVRTFCFMNCGNPVDP